MSKAKDLGLSYTDGEIDSGFQPLDSVLTNTTASYTTGEETKLNDIETLADVTDATNVDAAGAVMNSDTTTATMSFVIDEDTLVSNLATKVPTQQSVKAYVDTEVAAAITSEMSYEGGYNADTNTPDLDTTPSGISKGDVYTVTVAGTFFTANVEINDVLISEKANPTLETDWTIVNKNIDAATIEATVSHDNLLDFLANEHIDWTSDQGATNIHSGNYTNTIYSHPSDGVDPGAALTGANVFSDIAVNAAGHVTGSATRALTPANIGAESAFAKNTGFNKNLGTSAGTVSEGNHGHVAANISDFDTEVSNNTSVAANTSKVSNVTTNLGYTTAASTGTVTSSDGTDAILPAATISLAGLLTGADKTKLNGIDTSANNYSHPSDGADPGAALTGANVFSDIAVNAAGHVTGSATRALTPANIGAATSGHNHTIDELSNTTITTIIDNEILTYDNATGKWINETLAEAGISATGHGHTASEISDFDTEVSNNTSVAANTSKVSNVTTNLGYTTAASTGTVTSSDGIDATLPAATISLAGLLTGADKTKLNGIATSANNYSHPSDGIDLGAALTGANVISDVTVNTDGHVTGFATRALTPANIGAEPADATIVKDGDFATNGLMIRTGAGSYTNRTLTGTTNEVEVTNGDGVSGNPTIGLPNNVTIGNNLTVTGNLTINGTTTTINSSVVTIDDPIFTLGGDTAPVADDNKDRGIEFRYYDTAARVGFFGWDDSTNRFTAIGLATNTSEVFSGTTLDAQFGTVFAALSGNASTATKWATGRTITLTGDVTGVSGTFDGSGNLSFATTIAANSVALGTDTTGSYVQQGATSGSGLSGSVNTESGTFTVTSNATNANTASTLVFRDVSGNFSAGTITAALSGNATTATSVAKWTTGRTITLTGDVTGVSGAFDGSGNLSFATTIAANSFALGTDTTGNYVATIAGTANQVTVSGSGSETAAVTLSLPSDVTITGTLTAAAKSFQIPHPTKPDMKLRYGSLEGPENGVYIRGRLTADNIIVLPDYWVGLVDENTITVQLTSVMNNQRLFVKNVGLDGIEIGQGWLDRLFGKTIDCYYIVYAERKDIPKLIVEE